MPDNLNWNAVGQSVNDTWLPLIGVIVGCIAAVIIYKVIKNKIDR